MKLHKRREENTHTHTHTHTHTCAQQANPYFGKARKKSQLQEPGRVNAHLEQPVERLPDQRPAHGAPRQRQAALFVPGQAPAEAPQLPGQRQQQERGQDRGERGGQGRQHPELGQG